MKKMWELWKKFWKAGKKLEMRLGFWNAGTQMFGTQKKGIKSKQGRGTRKEKLGKRGNSGQERVLETSGNLW